MLAIALGVFAITAVRSVSDSLRSSISGQAQRLLAMSPGDFRMSSAPMQVAEYGVP